MPYEVANALRRADRSGEISADSATLAHVDLQDLNVELFPFDVTAWRAWELRNDLTMYAVPYVALAELLKLPLATLDGRLVSGCRSMSAVLGSPPSLKARLPSSPIPILLE